MLNSHKIANMTLILAGGLALMATAYAAYKGHANDRDISAVLSAYPDLKGSATDSCATCHRSGAVQDSGKSHHENGYGYCAQGFG